MHTDPTMSQLDRATHVQLEPLEGWGEGAGARSVLSQTTTTADYEICWLVGTNALRCIRGLAQRWVVEAGRQRDSHRRGGGLKPWQG